MPLSTLLAKMARVLLTEMGTASDGACAATGTGALPTDPESQAASESPFLDNKLESATGVLCVLRVPPSALGVLPPGSPSRQRSTAVGNGGPMVTDNHKEYALRSAVQVAAMTVRELVGPHCHDIIVCPQLCRDLETGQDSTNSDSDSGSSNAPSQPDSGAPCSGGAVGATATAAGIAASKQNVAGACNAAGAPAAEGAMPGEPQLVRVEVSLLVLERIEEAAEPKAIGAHKPSHDVASSGFYGGAAAASAPVAPTAATARDRMTSVFGARASSVARRLPPPGAPNPAANFFGNQQSQSTAATAAAPTTPSAATATNVNAMGIQSQPAGPAAGFAGQVNGGAGQANAAAGQPGAVNATVAETNRVRKQARLAAMSALAGGTPLGAAPPASATPTATHVHSNVGGVAVRGTGHLPQPLPPQQQQQQYATHLHHIPSQQQPQQLLHNVQQPSSMPSSQVQEGVPAGGGGMFGMQQIPRMADSLQVTSLVAQSLDLPPQAARWRHQQRNPTYSARGAFELPKVEADLREWDESWLEGVTSGQNEGLGRGLQQLIMGMWSSEGCQPASMTTGPSAVRTRVADMLEHERKDLWEGAAGNA